jgi:hypothetical protein
VSDENSHPYEHNGAIFCHNGVVYGDMIDDKSKWSDSYLYLRHIMQQSGNMVKKIVNATTDISGWLSCFMYYKGKLYYFKDGGSMHFAYNPATGTYIGATKTLRLKCFDSTSKVKGIFEVSDGEWFDGDLEDSIIYSITDDGIFEESKFNTMAWTRRSSNYKSNYGTRYGSSYSKDVLAKDKKSSGICVSGAKSNDKIIEISDEKQEADSELFFDSEYKMIPVGDACFQKDVKELIYLGYQYACFCPECKAVCADTYAEVQHGYHICPVCQTLMSEVELNEHEGADGNNAVGFTVLNGV